MKAFFLAALLSLFQFASAGRVSADPNGVILSSYFYCEIPCDSKMGLYLGVTTGSDVPRRIQTYVPSGPVAEREFETFSAFDQSTKTYTSIAADFPRESVLTLWVSTVSGNDVSSVQATPLVNGLEVAYPVSSSPAPLNNVKLVLAKIVQGPAGSILAIFTNGEVHSLDVKTGTFTLLHKLIDDSKALDVDFPTTAAAHVFDATRNGLWSVVSAGINAYVVFTDFTTKTVGEWVQLDASMLLDPGKDAVTTDFSPEFFVNALMVETTDGQGYRLMLQLESLDTIGFDMLTFVNTTTGVFEGPIYNLMNNNLVFECQSFNCDKDRVSTFDPITKTVWFQAHIAEGDNAGNIALNTITFEDAPATGKPTFYLSTPNPDADFGFTNFQFYNFN